jgi:hypothetical protein
MRKYLKELCDNVFLHNAFLYLLQSKGLTRPNDGGLSIQVPLIVDDNPNIRSYSGYDTLPTSPTEEFGFANFPWKQFAGGLSTCGFEQCVNGGSNAIFKLVDAKVQVLERSLEAYLNRMLLTSDGTGNSARDIYGLPRIIGGLAIDPATGLPSAPVQPEVGGLSAANADTAFWTSRLDDAGRAVAIRDGQPIPAAVPLTLKQISHMLNHLTIGNDGPDCIVLSMELWEGLEALFQPQLVQTNVAMAEAGFDNIRYRGVTFVWDRMVPADTAWFINTKYLNWDILGSCYMKMTPFMRPHDQDAQYAQILAVANLTTCDRRMHGVMCNRKAIC